MNALDQLLAEAAAAHTAPSLTSLLGTLAEDDPSTAIRDSSAGPLGHLTCLAAIQAIEDGDTFEPDPIDALLAGLADQQSLLTLNDAVDALLASGPFVERYGQRLCNALLRGHRDAVDDRPLIAAGHLEGALRLAITDAALPLKVLSVLEIEDATTIDPAYAERLPRLIGAALDRWPTDEAIASMLRRGLDALRSVPDAAVDATFEHGLDLLRRAANAHATTALELLVQARQQMSSAAVAEEARDDAALYGAGIDAIVAFTRADRSLLAASQASVTQLLDHREAWLRGLHIPDWRRPRQEAERAWAKLLLVLTRAADQLDAPAWLNAWEALAIVLEAYELDRAVNPVPGTIGAEGLEAVIRPTIEMTIAREQSLLATLRHAADTAASMPRPPLTSSQLHILRQRIDSLTERPDEQRHAREAEDASEDDPSVLQRLIATAPALLASLGQAKATYLARNFDDTALALMEGVAYQRVAQSAGGPAVDSLRRKIEADLQPCPDYSGLVRQYFDLLTWELATFLAARHDMQLTGDLAYR